MPSSFLSLTCKFILDPGSAPKTLLLFVIRDHIGVTPLENLKAVLRESLEKIWKELTKPKGLEQATLERFFDLEYAALPHKILQAEKFDTEAEVLRQRFVQADAQDYVFRPAFHRKVPADGFPHYASSIWEKVNENKDLDLPTQQQLLAQYRCDELLNEAYKGFSAAVKTQEKSIESGKVVEDFGALAKMRDDAVDAFAKDASRYHAEVYSRKRGELLEKVNGTLHILFVGQLRNLQKSTLHKFKNDVQKIVAEDAENFALRLVAAQSAANEYFRTHAKEALLPGTGWNNDEAVNSFTEELEEFAARIRVEEMEKLIQKLLVRFKSLNTAL
jgi:hypothetical protein